MGYNKIPLALRFDDSTGNADGLIEFQLNVSDIGDICEDNYDPQPGDVLTYNNALKCWTASAPPAVAAGALSALTDVCDTLPGENQALVWNGSAWCPSSIPTGGGGGGITSISDAGDVTITEPVADRELLAYDDATSDWINQTTTELGIMQLDPYFTAGDDGAVAQWDGTKLEVKFPDALFIRVTQDNTVHPGENISKGDAVYATTTTESGGRIYVGLANAADPTRMPAIGIAEADILAGNSGKIISFGRADGVNTTSDGTATVGDTLYVGTTNGELAANKPDQPSELIQNVGIVTQAGTSGRIKVTGVGRSNDIPNNLDVVGSVTVGDTVISQTDAKLANVDANHILISTATSATSSVTSATFFGNYYTKSEADGQFLEETTNLTGIADVTGTPAGNYILQRNSGNSNWDPVTMNAALLATGERVEDHAIGDLSDVQKSGQANADILQLRSGTWSAVSFTEASEYTGGDGFLADNGIVNTFHVSGGDPLVRLDASSASAALTEAYTFTIPSGTLGDYKDVEIDYYGRHLNNAGTGGNLRVAFIMGGVGILNSQTSQGTGTNPMRWHLKIKLASMTGNKYLVFLNWTQGAQSFSTSGQGNIGSMHREGVMHSEATLTSTVDNDIRFEIRHESFASVTEKYFTIDSVRAKVLPAVVGAE